MPGAGKTTFGIYYGLSRCQEGYDFYKNFGSVQNSTSCQTIPLYATFNNKTFYNIKDINENFMLSTRILFDFLHSIHLLGGNDSNF